MNEMIGAIVAASSIFWFAIGTFVHFQIFNDLFDFSTWRKALLSIVFGGPFILAYFVGFKIVKFLRKFRQ